MCRDQTPQSVQLILDKVPEVWKSTYRAIAGVEAHIHVDKDTKPLFFKARPIPYTLREIVAAETDQLLEEDIIVQGRRNWVGWA